MGWQRRYQLSIIVSEQYFSFQKTWKVKKTKQKCVNISLENLKTVAISMRFKL